MNASDAAEQINEMAESMEDGVSANERFRARAALTIAIMAMLLAITSLGGGNASEARIANNIEAQDTWAFFQAKNVRQTAYRLAADDLRLRLETMGPEVSAAARALYQQKIDEYQVTIDRYESEPDPNDPEDLLKGEGKAQLAAQAREKERLRDLSDAQGASFDYAEAFYQIAIVLMSVAILATSRPLLWVALALGGIASILMINGFFSLFQLPF